MGLGGGREAADGCLGVAEDLAADEAVAGEVPDPGDGEVADAEVAAAGVDPSPHQQRGAAALDDLLPDLQLVPGAVDVAEVLAQALGPMYGAVRPISSAVPTGKNSRLSSQRATISSGSRRLKAS